MTRQDIIDEARKWLGVPWRHQGRTRRGVDCVGLVVMVGQALNIPHEDRTDYGREPAEHTLIDHMRKYLSPVPGLAINPGIVAVFRQSRYPCHVGIFSEINGVIHVINSRADARKVIEEPFVDGRHGLSLLHLLSFPGLDD